MFKIFRRFKFLDFARFASGMSVVQPVAVTVNPQFTAFARRKKK